MRTMLVLLLTSEGNASVQGVFSARDLAEQAAYRWVDECLEGENLSPFVQPMLSVRTWTAGTDDGSTSFEITEHTVNQS